MSELPNTKGMGSIPQVEVVGDTHVIALTGASDVLHPLIDVEDVVRIERDGEDLFD